MLGLQHMNLQGHLVQLITTMSAGWPGFKSRLCLAELCDLGQSSYRRGLLRTQWSQPHKARRAAPGTEK